MKLIYFDCFSGISGDMILGALADAGMDIKVWKSEVAKLHLKGVRIVFKKVVRREISATRAEVVLPKRLLVGHRGLREIIKIIQTAKYTKDVTDTSIAIFKRLAEAEARVHRIPLEKVHFHELGALDTIIDIVGSVIGFKLLGINQWQTSALNLGSGSVRTLHGTLPVPAPATAELLKGHLSYGSAIPLELTTPTGAAIVTTLAKETGVMPLMHMDVVGYGAGGHELKAQANTLRIFIGRRYHENERDQVALLETNIDDMNPEAFDYAMKRLLQEGALDVFLTPITMKRSRPAVHLTVLAPLPIQSRLEQVLFEETTTLGLRVSYRDRVKLDREIRVVTTKWGKVRVKIGSMNGRVLNIKPEYDDCVRIASRKRVPLKLVMQSVNESLSVSKFGNAKTKSIP